MILLPILAALFLGDIPTGSIIWAEGLRAYSVPAESMQLAIMKGTGFSSTQNITKPEHHNAVILSRRALSGQASR
jgi:hypothetical protein